MAKAGKKIGTSREAVAQRRAAFKAAYLTNGHNATQAALVAGFSAKTAHVQGAQLLKVLKSNGELADMAERAAEAAELTVERTLREVARLSYADPRRMYHSDGRLKDIHELDDDMAAAVASVEIEEEFDGKGEDRKLNGYTKKLKLWDKNSALDKAMKHFGLYEQDNRQKGEAIKVEVVLVQPPARPALEAA
jgi:phage terminase small subunit